MNIIDRNDIEKALLSNGVLVECKSDSYVGVLKADEEIALLTARGMNVVIDMSHIVEADVVKAITRYCNTAGENGGNVTIIVSVDHPKLQNILRLHVAYNCLTIKVNDEFMRALADGETYGDGEAGFNPNSLWNQIAHCDIIFHGMELKPYCRVEMSSINLRDYVVYNREKSTFDRESFNAKYEELLAQSNERAKAYVDDLKQMMSESANFQADERQLFNEILENTGNNRLNVVHATSIDSMLQAMELNSDSQEAADLMSAINEVCHYKVEVVPAACNGRTLEHKAACLKAWANKCDGLRIARDRKPLQHYMAAEEHILKRPNVLEADVVRFQNKKEKWIAFIGLIDGRPYEVFTGIADDDEGIFCPKSVNYGKIIKAVDEHGQKRYDFQFINKRGFKTTIEGLSEKFNPEFWNYAKLISGVLRYGMPIEQVVKLVSSLELDNLSINNWKSGVIKALKRYLPNPDPES